MSKYTRQDIDNRYKFDLSQIFESAAEWDRACEDLLTDIEGVKTQTEKSLETPKDFQKFLDRVANCYRKKQRLELYAELWQNTHTNSGQADDQMRRFRAVEQEFEPVIAAARHTLSEAENATLEALTADFDETHYLENLLDQSQHTRIPDVEQTIATLDEALSAPNRILWATEDDIEPPTVERPEGKEIEITYSRFRKELAYPDREYRRRVYEVYYNERSRFEQTFAKAYAEKLKAASALADVRGYDSLREMAFHQECYPENGLRASLPSTVHDVMLETIQDNLKPRNHARKIRASRLGVNTLRPWDLQASISDSPEPDISFEDAKSHIVDALALLGEEYQTRLRQFFEEGRIDVYEYGGKRNIPAYCPSSAEDGAFILMNYQNNGRTMFYLCHELGHAMHVAHHRERPVQYATCPRPIEEIPSFLHELLLIEYCLSEGGVLADFARDRLLRGFGGNFYGAAMHSAFTHRLARTIDAGEDLTVARIADVYTNLQAEFEPTVERDTEARKEWLRTSLVREPYHYYQYPLGVVGALAIRDQLRGNQLTPSTYHDFLRDTGRKDSVSLFNQLGLDMTTSTPYVRAATVYDKLLNTL